MHHLLLQAGMVADIVKQGPLFGCLVLAVGYFYKQQEKNLAALDAIRTKHDADMQAANDKLETYMKEDREIMLTAINNSTRALEKIANGNGVH